MGCFKGITACLALLLLLSGCFNDEAEQVTTHCYFVAGIEMVTGKAADWGPSGYVKQVFDFYKDDPCLEYFGTKNFTRDEVAGWLASGYRVVIQYKTSASREHAEYITRVEACDGHEITYVHVAGYFAEDEQCRVEAADLPAADTRG